jgi:ABC-type sugar transport system ATPase subunit
VRVLDVEIEVARRDLEIAAAFSVAAGERIALFGPSGAGKTTILEIIAGLLSPSRGSVSLRGRQLTRIDGRVRHQVPAWSRRVGLLRQDPGLFPHLSVEDNLTYSRSAAAAPELMILIAKRLEIAHLLNYRARALSGGQAHRVALARMLLAGNEALLFDEPYTGLDARLRRILTEVVREESSARRVPAVLVAHELIEAQAFADRIAVIDDGRIRQVAPPDELVHRPATRRVAELVGYQGFLPARGGATVGVHPDRTIPGAQPERGVVVRGVVVGRRAAGAGWEADLCIGDSEAPLTLTCRIHDDPPIVGPELVITVVDPPWFDAAGALRPARQGARR